MVRPTHNTMCHAKEDAGRWILIDLSLALSFPEETPPFHQAVLETCGPCLRGISWEILSVVVGSGDPVFHSHNETPELALRDSAWRFRLSQLLGSCSFCGSDDRYPSLGLYCLSKRTEPLYPQERQSCCLVCPRHLQGNKPQLVAGARVCLSCVSTLTRARDFGFCWR